MSARSDDRNGGGIPRRSDAGAVGRESEATGLPGFRTWRAVYTVVLGIFILWVGLLTWLTERYS